MRPFAYALHEYGMYVLDSTGGPQYPYNAI